MSRALATKLKMVRLACVRKHASVRGVWGDAPSRKFLKFRHFEMASEAILGFLASR